MSNSNEESSNGDFSFFLGLVIDHAKTFNDLFSKYFIHFCMIQDFNVLLSIFVLLYVLIGGTQTAFGPLIGALFFTLVPEFLRVSNDWRFVFFGVVIVMMMVVRPEGIVTRTMTERFAAILTFLRGASAKP